MVKNIFWVIVVTGFAACNLENDKLFKKLDSEKQVFISITRSQK